MKSSIWLIAGVAIGAAAYLILNPQQPRYVSGTGSDDLEQAAKKASLWGTDKRVSGIGGGLVGKAKEGIGKVTGDDDLAAEGLVDQFTGAVEDGAGKVAHAVSDTIREVNQ